MKFKNGSKRFLTLNPNNSEGFTLVELIVVIAILAILAGVAVPAYNGYIEKANKQADISLVNEIENAMILSYYGDGTTDGFVILTADGTYASESLERAMTDTFGAEYAALTLQHGGWAPQLSSGGNAAAILNSMYVSGIGTTQLLGDVQNCTSALGEFLHALNGGELNSSAETLAALLNGDGTVFTDIMSTAGYYDADTGAYSNLTKDALANATLFSVADYVTNNADSVYLGISGGEDGTELYLNEDIYDAAMGEDEMIYIAANWYASMEALATYIGGDVEETWRGIDLSGKSATEVLRSMSTTHQTILNLCFDDGEPSDEFMAYYQTPVGSTGKTQAELDADAYIAMMSTVNTLSDGYTKPEYLNQADLVTGDEISGALNAYVSNAQLTSDLSSVENELVQSILAGTYEGGYGIIYMFTNNGQTSTYCDMADVG